MTHRSVLKQSAMFICKISQNTVNWPTESKTEKLDVAKLQKAGLADVQMFAISKP